jgi:hypothetical protein
MERRKDWEKGEGDGRKGKYPFNCLVIFEPE